MPKGYKMQKYGMVTIPKEIRDKLDLKQGDQLEFSVKYGQVRIKKKKID